MADGTRWCVGIDWASEGVFEALDLGALDLGDIGMDARQHLQGFLLRHGRIHSGNRGWTQACRRRLITVRFDHPAQQILPIGGSVFLSEIRVRSAKSA